MIPPLIQLRCHKPRGLSVRKTPLWTIEASFPQTFRVSNEPPTTFMYIKTGTGVSPLQAATKLRALLANYDGAYKLIPVVEFLVEAYKINELDLHPSV